MIIMKMTLIMKKVLSTIMIMVKVNDSDHQEEKNNNDDIID